MTLSLTTPTLEAPFTHADCAPVWSTFDDEGWAVFHAHDTDDEGELRIERIDEADAFVNDLDVWDHVAARVMAGSHRHADALSRVFDNNTTEREAILAHVGPGLSRLLLEKLA